MLNRIARNRTVLTSKLCTDAKLNYLKYNCFDINSALPIGQYTECPDCDTGQSG